MKKSVFPLKEHEAKELYRVGTSIGGPLSRQNAESMSQYISRRKRWWKKLAELDSKLSVSDTILTDLLLDNAGLSRSEKLMILTATHDSPTFESASEALLRQHGRIHIRESRNGPRSVAVNLLPVPARVKVSERDLAKAIDPRKEKRILHSVPMTGTNGKMIMHTRQLMMPMTTMNMMMTKIPTRTSRLRLMGSRSLPRD